MRQFAAVLAFASVATIVSGTTLQATSFTPIWVAVALTGLLAAAAGAALRLTRSFSESPAPAQLAMEAGE